MRCAAHNGNVPAPVCGPPHTTPRHVRCQSWRRMSHEVGAPIAHHTRHDALRRAKVAGGVRFMTMGSRTGLGTREAHGHVCGDTRAVLRSCFGAVDIVPPCKAPCTPPHVRRKGQVRRVPGTHRGLHDAPSRRREGGGDSSELPTAMAHTRRACLSRPLASPPPPHTTAT